MSEASRALVPRAVDQVLELVDAVAGERRREELAPRLTAALRRIFPADRVIVSLLSDDHTMVYAWTADPPPSAPLPTQRAADYLSGRRPLAPAPVVVKRADLGDVPRHLETWKQYDVQSSLRIPLTDGADVYGALSFWSGRADAYDRADLALAREVGRVASVAVQRALAFERMDRLRRRAAVENEALLADVHARQFRPLLGDSEATRAVRRLIDTVAPTAATVLITGESGTGKGLVARMLHEGGPRRAGPLITVNCAALPTALAESELFGHEAGAFTSAIKRRKGRFELAEGGTLFLDEVGELPAEVQGKLLRVLQEREVERIGGTETLRVDVRVVAATNRDLPRLVEQGAFRADLYYRLSVFPIEIPPLRERPEDIPALVDAFVERAARRHRREPPRITAEAMTRLCAYDWPGNVREMENAIERALILSTGDLLAVDGILPAAAEATGEEEAERARYREALAGCEWVIEGRRGAAARLGVHPNTLRYRLKRLGVVRPK